MSRLDLSNLAMARKVKKFFFLCCSKEGLPPHENIVQKKGRARWVYETSVDTKFQTN